MGNTIDVLSIHLQIGWWNPQKRWDLAHSVEPRFGSKGCICHAILNEREKIFKAHHIYIYIYGKRITMWHKLNFATLCLYVKESSKALCGNTSEPPFWQRIFLEKDFHSFENGLLGNSRSLFQKESPGGQCQFLFFWKHFKDYGIIKSFKG